MMRLGVLALGLALVTVALPATVTASEDDQTIREQNRQWILEKNPDYDPEAVVELHTGEGVEEVTAREALERALDRAGETSLPSLVSAEGGGGGGTVTGDVWLIGWGNVDCGELSRLVPQDQFWYGSGPQMWVYEGYVGYASHASADTWHAISWTWKTDIHGAGAIHYGGLSDFLCFDGPAFALLFPFIDGYASDEVPHPPVLVDKPLPDDP